MRKAVLVGKSTKTFLTKAHNLDIFIFVSPEGSGGVVESIQNCRKIFDPVPCIRFIKTW